MTCVNCKNQMDFYFTKKEFRIFKCTHCKLMAVENVPDDLAPYYGEGYFTGDVTLDGYMDYEVDKQVTKKTYLGYLDKIEQEHANKTSSDLFEVGCATGFFLELAKQRGWSVSGIDLSAYAVERGKEKGLAVSTDTFESISGEKKYDVIAMYDLIEHVKDPIETIRKAHTLLRDNGLLVITTPDAGSLWAKVWGKKWHAFVPPQHLFYFSDKNLCEILVANGFEIRKSSHDGKRFAIPYIIRLLYSWTGMRLFSKLAEWSSQTFLKNISIPINVRDTAFIIARKV